MIQRKGVEFDRYPVVPNEMHLHFPAFRETDGRKIPFYFWAREEIGIFILINEKLKWLEFILFMWRFLAICEEAAVLPVGIWQYIFSIQHWYRLILYLLYRQKRDPVFSLSSLQFLLFHLFPWAHYMLGILSILGWVLWAGAWVIYFFLPAALHSSIFLRSSISTLIYFLYIPKYFIYHMYYISRVSSK